MKILSPDQKRTKHYFTDSNDGPVLDYITGYDKGNNIGFASLKGRKRLTHEDTGIITNIAHKYRRPIKNPLFLNTIYAKLQETVTHQLEEDVETQGSCVISAYVIEGNNFSKQDKTDENSQGPVIVISNLGDGRSFLVIRDKHKKIIDVQNLTENLHNPTQHNKEERKRIQEAGGTINKKNRIYVDEHTGGLNVSGTIGDNDYNHNKPIITRIPTVTCTFPKLNEGETAEIVLSCDGPAESPIIEKMGSLKNFVKTTLENCDPDSTPEERSKHLTMEAYVLGSNDNITITTIGGITSPQKNSKKNDKKIRIATICDGHRGECNIYFLAEKPDEKELNKYQNAYLIYPDQEKFSIAYISIKNKLEKLQCDDQNELNILAEKIKEIKKFDSSKPLQIIFSTDQLQNVWKLITANKGHKDNEVSQFLEDNFASILNKALTELEAKQRQQVKELLNLAANLSEKNPNPNELKKLKEILDDLCLNLIESNDIENTDLTDDLLAIFPNDDIYTSELKNKFATISTLLPNCEINFKKVLQFIDKKINPVNEFFTDVKKNFASLLTVCGLVPSVNSRNEKTKEEMGSSPNNEQKNRMK